MKYLFLPLNQHCDDGLGATGEAFEDSAKLLINNAAEISHCHYKIPVCYLYRHAIELYLKSVTVILHRSLAIPYGENPSEGLAFVQVDAKWKPIYQVHSIAQLWAHIFHLLQSSKPELGRRCKTDWLAVPEDLIKSIAEIERIDGRSTFFRYPDHRRPDVELTKSMWKSKSVDELQKAVSANSKPAKILLMVDQDDQITEGFQFDDSTLSEVVDLLKNTAETLSGMHLGLRTELAGGF
jgi:hypothetical protein